MSEKTPKVDYVDAQQGPTITWPPGAADKYGSDRLREIGTAMFEVWWLMTDTRPRV
jgi:hypothetical protein